MWMNIYYVLDIVINILMWFIYLILSSQLPYEASTIIISTLQMKELVFRETK